MDEQEALLKDAIENLKARKEHRSQQADYSLKLLAHYLALIIQAVDLLIQQM